MQRHVVVAELDVARLQVHVEMDVGIVRQLIAQIEGGAFDRFQGNAGLGARRVDLVADQSNAYKAVAGAEHRTPLAAARRHSRSTTSPEAANSGSIAATMTTARDSRCSSPDSPPGAIVPCSSRFPRGAMRHHPQGSQVRYRVSTPSHRRGRQHFTVINETIQQLMVARLVLYSEGDWL
jgi:hypothetical protein